MAEIELRNVSHRYGDVRAVDDLSLLIGNGEFVVLLGPSGCGKSSTLRLIAGLERPESGEIRIHGEVVNESSAQARDVAFVFQSYALYPHMTVAENIMFPLKMRDVDRAARRRKATEVAALLGIEELLDRYPAQLSGGQRQRVALGRAIVREPAAFLLDEPLSNLDAQLRAEMRISLVRLQREIGGTFVFVTHDQVEAMTLADRVAIMRDGALQQFDEPERIYREPANTFVARFVGSPRMNLIRGRVTDGDDTPRFVSDALSFELPPGVGRPPVGHEVTLGFRGADVILDDAGPLHAVVEVVEPLGNETYVYSTTATGGEQVVLRVPTDARPTVGERLGFRIPPEAVHWFDAETGERIGAGNGAPA